jgi:hypothetical protein
MNHKLNIKLIFEQNKINKKWRCTFECPKLYDRILRGIGITPAEAMINIILNIDWNDILREDEA